MSYNLTEDLRLFNCSSLFSSVSFTGISVKGYIQNGQNKTKQKHVLSTLFLTHWEPLYRNTVSVCGLKELTNFPKVPNFPQAELTLQLCPRWFLIHPDDRKQSQSSLFNWFASTHWPPGLCLYSLSCRMLRSSPPFKSTFLLRFEIRLSRLITVLNSMLGFLQHQLTSLLGWWGDRPSLLLLLNIKGRLFHS